MGLMLFSVIHGWNGNFAVIVFAKYNYRAHLSCHIFVRWYQILNRTLILDDGKRGYKTTCLLLLAYIDQQVLMSSSELRSLNVCYVLKCQVLSARALYAGE